MKAIFIDTETTGREPKIHGIIQIAGIIFIDGVEKERFDIKMQPAPGRQIDAEALQITGTSLSDIAGYQTAREGWTQFVTVLNWHISRYDNKDKFFFVAYNARFDDDFLRELWNSMGDNYYGSWFWTPVIDIMVLAGVRLSNMRPAMPNFKLETLSKVLGVEPKGDLHDAMVDIEMTVDVARIVAPELFTKE